MELIVLAVLLVLDDELVVLKVLAVVDELDVVLAVLQVEVVVCPTAGTLSKVMSVT